MISYQEVLSRCLEAVRQGRDLESVLTSLPSRHVDRLRADAVLAQAMRSDAGNLPAPSAAAERAAADRLRSQLASQRVAGGQPASGWFAGFRLPRYTIAAVVIAAILITGSFLLPGSSQDGAEAATLEGVVVASGGDSLTVQTLDTLEAVSIPAGTQVSDESGVALDLASIEVGEVVVVRGSRQPGGPIRANNVQRRLNGLPAWCQDNAARCRQIAQQLESAHQRCQAQPQACPMISDRVNQLIHDVGEVVMLEELRQRCREAGRDVCQDFAEFCRQHADLCIAPDPPAPIDRLEEARERLIALNERCSNRDTAACRQVAQICGQHPVLCPATSPQERTAPQSRPAADATPTRDLRPLR